MSSHMFTEITDHTAQAKARQVEFFKDKPNFDALIGIFTDRLQELESVIVDFRDKRHIDGAEGIQIDKLGQIFLESRGGLGDEPYRSAVKNAYAKKAKSGEWETLIQAYSAYTGANRVVLTYYYPHTMILNAEVDDPSAVETTHINSGMQKIRAGGKEMDCTMSLSEGAFSFISLGDNIDTSLGWSSIADSTSGGTFGSIV